MINTNELRQFSGTENYYRHWCGGLLYTDGIKYLAEHGGTNGAFWLIDAIGSYQRDKKLQQGDLRDMQFWHLHVNSDKSAVLTCRADSDKPPVISQRIEFTDFDQQDIDIWVGRDERGPVAMLPSEY